MVPTFLIFREDDNTFRFHRQKEFEILDETRLNSVFAQGVRLATIRDTVVPTSEGLQLESYEDRGREEYEVITDPFARPSSLLFLRYAWPVNCVSHGWPSW